jgi:hypothetical protein
VVQRGDESVCEAVAGGAVEAGGAEPVVELLLFARCEGGEDRVVDHIAGDVGVARAGRDGANTVDD